MEEVSTTTQGETKGQLISVGDLVSQTIALYKTSYLHFIKLQFFYYLALIPVALAASLLGAFYFYTTQSKIAESMQINVYGGLGILGLIALLFTIYYSILFSIAPYMLLKDFDLKRKISEISFSGKKYFWPVTSTSLLVGLLVLFGFLLLIIPGIYWLIKYAFTLLVTIFEDKKNSAALKRSAELTNGRWWEIFLRFFILWIVSSGVSMIAIGISQPLPQDMQWIASLISFALSITIAPGLLIYTYLLFKDLVRLTPNK